jgi:hypothetical protein
MPPFFCFLAEILGVDLKRVDVEGPQARNELLLVLRGVQKKKTIANHARMNWRAAKREATE